MGDRTFNQIFKKNDNWKCEHKLDEFLFGINDGDYFIQAAYNHFNITKQIKDEFQINFRRIGRYSIENYIYDPINLFFALNYLLNDKKQKLDKKDNDSYFNHVVDFLSKINESKSTSISEFINNNTSDYVQIFNDIISKTNDYFLTKINQDKKSSDFKVKFNLNNFQSDHLKQTISISFQTIGHKINLNYFPLLVYFKGKQTAKYLGNIIGEVNSKITNSKIPEFSIYLKEEIGNLFGNIPFNPISYFLALHLFAKYLKDNGKNTDIVFEFLSKIQKIKFETVDEYLVQFKSSLNDKFNEIIDNTEKIYKNHENIYSMINDEQIKTNKKKDNCVYFLIHAITKNINSDDKRTKNIITRLKQDKSARKCFQDLNAYLNINEDYKKLLNINPKNASEKSDKEKKAQEFIEFLDTKLLESEREIKSSKINFEVCDQKFEYCIYEIFEHEVNKKILTDIYFSDLNLELEVPIKTIIETFKKTGFLMDSCLIEIMENILK